MYAIRSYYESHETAHNHLNHITLGIDVAAYLHVGVAPAKDAQVVDLYLRDSYNFV